MIKTRTVIITEHFVVCDQCGERAPTERTEQAAIDAAIADGFSSQAEQGWWYCSYCSEFAAARENYRLEDDPAYWQEKLAQWTRNVNGANRLENA